MKLKGYSRRICIPSRLRCAGSGGAWSRGEVDRAHPSPFARFASQCIKYLEEPVHPLRRQTNASVNKLLDELEKVDLTKAERLQILNLAPTTLVALVVVRSLVTLARWGLDTDAS